MTIHIRRISIRNFRSFRDTTIYPNKLTVIIGANGAGKSTLIDAISLVLHAESGVKAPLESDYPDTLSPQERKLPENRMSVELEIEIPDDPVYSALFLGHLHVDHQELRYIVVRYENRYEDREGDFRPCAFFVNPWSDNRGSEQSFGLRHRRALPHYSLPAVRDASSQFSGARTSLWRRLVETVQLGESERAQLSQKAAELDSLLSQGEQFARISAQLRRDLGALFPLSNETTDVTYSLITLDGEQLFRNLEIGLKAYGFSQPVPITRHALGVQNTAVLALFKAYAVEMERTTSATPTLAIEEPEAHLQPTGQRVLFKELSSLPSQVFISTHSPHLANAAGIRSVVLVRKEGTQTVARQLRETIPDHELRNIERFITAERAELFFSNCVILVEGDSEAMALPMFSKLLGIDLDKLGITLLRANSHEFAEYLKIMKPANLDIPWVVVTDTDGPNTIPTLLVQCRNAGLITESDLHTGRQSPASFGLSLLEEQRFVLLSRDFERTMWANGHYDLYKRKAAALTGRPDFLDEYRRQRQNQPNFPNGEPEQFFEFISKRRLKVRLALEVTRELADASEVPVDFQRALRVAEATARRAMGV